MRASARGLGLLPTTHDFGSTPHSGNGVDLCSTTLWVIRNDLDSIQNRAIGTEDASITHWVTRIDLSSNANRANGSQLCSIAQWGIGSDFDSSPELSNCGEFVSTAHWVNWTDLCPSVASARTNVTRPCGELAREARKPRRAQRMDTTGLRSIVPCSLPSIPHTVPAKRIRSCTLNALARCQGAEGSV